MAFNKLSKRIYTKRDITLGTAVSFGITDFIGGGGQTIIGAWMLFFYTSYCNLTATDGAIIVGVGKIVTAIVGLLMGGFTDNFYKHRLGKKFGRRHFFLFIGSPLLLCFALMWVSGLNFWYYLLTFAAFDAISTAVMIPFETLPTEMTTDFNKRTKLSTARMFFSASATFLATFIPGQLFRILGQNSPVPFFINGLLFAIIFAIAMFFTAFNTWERPVSEIATDDVDEKESFFKVFAEDIKAYFSTFKIKSFRKHLAIYLFSFTGKDVYNTVFTYFCVYVLGVTATVAANVLSLSIVGVAMTLVGGFLIIKFGPRWLYMFGYSLMLLMLVAYYLIAKTMPEHIVALLFVVSFVYQIGRSTLEFTPWNVYPFIPDVDEIVAGKNRAGVFASVMTFLRNATAALATVLVGVFLDANGFVKGAKTQPLGTQHAILNALVFGAGGLIIIALLFALTFKVNKKTHGIVVDEVNRLKAGGSKADATEETKSVVKTLTGIDYANVWPAGKTVKGNK
ncbi:MFS transporter [Agrilactobacillus yilanensis]|uniref:MFS transporter n=1 Tax=Agrilactobacillus yilanensis TaxID=2485997 RepID=A0ABW4J6L3_9LACO|nr:MFS transporter [Agrilactobacillus yilanensis]